ncbi:MAG: exonuclease [Bacteroidia bacterium]|nr:MAG: exonuclease [Bacteroidia bacterium]
MGTTDFVALDFETANYSQHSVCAIALVDVRGGQATDTYYRLCRPEPNRYTFTHIHGIARRDTDHQPTFAALWPEMLPRIDGRLLVAHNAPFDIGVLRATVHHYGLPAPDLRYLCTLQMARRATKLRGVTLSNYRLPTVATHYGYRDFTHHQALADAQACAHIFLQIQRELGITTEGQLATALGSKPKDLHGVGHA